MSFENDEKSYKNVKMNKIKFEQIIPVQPAEKRISQLAENNSLQDHHYVPLGRQLGPYGWATMRMASPMLGGQSTDT